MTTSAPHVTRYLLSRAWFISLNFLLALSCHILASCSTYLPARIPDTIGLRKTFHERFNTCLKCNTGAISNIVITSFNLGSTSSKKTSLSRILCKISEFSPFHLKSAVWIILEIQSSHPVKTRAYTHIDKPQMKIKRILSSWSSHSSSYSTIQSPIWWLCVCVTILMFIDS